MQIRNIAIIAHVDHGKTTLVDKMLQQSGIFRANQEVQVRVMDSNDLERERGITILAKNTSVLYEGVKINIVDTPGHADFGGEVERILSMVDGVLLLVDAFEGPMPQTRFVLKKALSMHLKPIVVINKIDRPDSRIAEVEEEVLELFMDLCHDGSGSMLDYPTIYVSARDGVAKASMSETAENLKPLFEAILNDVPAPVIGTNSELQMQVTTLLYDEYVGRIAVGKIIQGTLRSGDMAALCRTDGTVVKSKISQLYTFNGLKRESVESVEAGDIAAVSGLGDVNIGDTLSDADNTQPLPPIYVDEPTIKMLFSTNDYPFVGQY